MKKKTYEVLSKVYLLLEFLEQQLKTIIFFADKYKDNPNDYYDQFQGEKREEVSNNNWLSKIHGANILLSLFQELCENKLEFRKIKHSKKLTEWLVENKPDFLSELAEELGNFLHKNQ